MSLVVKSQSFTVVLAPAEVANAIDDAVIDTLLEMVGTSTSGAFDLGAHRAILLACERARIVQRPQNPAMVYFVIEGSEDEESWALNKVTVDGWKDLRLAMDLPSGKLVVRDALGASKQELSAPAGPYKLLEYRGSDPEDGTRSWVCLLASKSVWDKLAG